MPPSVAIQDAEAVAGSSGTTGLVMRALFDPVSLAVSGLPIGLLVALLRGAPFGALEFGATVLLAGAVAGAPAGFVLCRCRRRPSTWTLKLIVIMPAAPVAMYGAFAVGAWMPLYTWEPLPAAPSRATSLTGPDCYDIGEAVVYAHTVTGQIYRLELRARGSPWVAVDAVPVTAESYYCDASTSSGPAAAIAIDEAGGDCGGVTRVRLRSNGEILASHNGSCGLLVLGMLMIGAVLSLALPVIAWGLAYFRQHSPPSTA